MYKNIYIDAPSLGSDDKIFIGKAIDAGYVSSAGSFVGNFEKNLLSNMASNHPAIKEEILSTMTLSEELEMKLSEAIEGFKKIFVGNK